MLDSNWGKPERGCKSLPGFPFSPDAKRLKRNLGVDTAKKSRKNKRQRERIR